MKMSLELLFIYIYIFFLCKTLVIFAYASKLLLQLIASNASYMTQKERNFKM